SYYFAIEVFKLRLACGFTALIKSRTSEVCKETLPKTSSEVPDFKPSFSVLMCCLRTFSLIVHFGYSFCIRYRFKQSVLFLHDFMSEMFTLRHISLGM